jgi:hypothetical protein
MEIGTDVDPTGVIRYGTEISSLLQDFTTGLDSELEGLAGARVGMCGLPEAATARDYHARVVAQLGELLGHVGTGVQALSQGAVTIGANYLRADEAQRGEMSLAADAFAPQPGQPSLSALQQQQAAAQAQEDARVQQQVQAGRSPLPAPTDTTPEADDDPADLSDAQDAVQEHQETYGEDENKYDGQQVQPGEPRPEVWGPLPHWVDDQLTQ